MRLVLDTNVVASALLWHGNPRRLMQTDRGEGIQLFTSAPLLAELTDILSRAKFAKKIAASLLSVDQLVDLYSEFASVVRAAPVPRIAPDPDDDVVIGSVPPWRISLKLGASAENASDARAKRPTTGRFRSMGPYPSSIVRASQCVVN